MNSLVHYILELFRNEDAAREFVVDPAVSLADAGLHNVTPEQVASAAASAAPGLMLAADPIAGLQQAVSNQFGILPVNNAVATDTGASSTVDGGIGIKSAAGVINDSALGLGVDGGSALATAFAGGFGTGLGGGGQLGSLIGANLGTQNSTAGNANIGLGTNGLGAAGGSTINTATNAGFTTPLGSAAFGTQAAATNTAAVSILSNDSAALGGQANAGAGLGSHTNFGAGMGVNNSFGAGLGTNTSFGAGLGGNSNTAAGLGGQTNVAAEFGGHTNLQAIPIAAHSEGQTYGHANLNADVAQDIRSNTSFFGHESAALGAHGSAQPAAAGAAQTAGQVSAAGGAQMHTAATAQGGGAFGQHAVADASAGGSVVAHQSSAIDQHSAVASSTSLAGQSQTHSGFDPFAQLGVETSHQDLFDAGHHADTNSSHIDTGATSHSTIDQHMGL